MPSPLRIWKADTRDSYAGNCQKNDISIISVVVEDGVVDLSTNCHEQEEVGGVVGLSVEEDDSEGEDDDEGVQNEIGVFQYCTKLKTVKLPESLRKIGQRAFLHCEALVKVDIPEAVEIIGEFSFACCKSLSSITLPERLEEIKEYAFERCDRLTNVVLPSNLRSIGSYAFSNCSSLVDVNWEDLVLLERIGQRTFENTAIERAALPDTLISIGMDCFDGSRNLVEVTIPLTVGLHVDKGAFARCSPQLKIAVRNPHKVGSGSSKRWSASVGKDLKSGQQLKACAGIGDCISVRVPVSKLKKFRDVILTACSSESWTQNFEASADNFMSIYTKLSEISVLATELSLLFQRAKEAEEGLWRSVRNFTIGLGDLHNDRTRKGWLALAYSAFTRLHDFTGKVDETRIEALEEDIIDLEEYHSQLLHKPEGEIQAEHVKNFVPNIREKFEMNKTLIVKAEEFTRNSTKAKENLLGWRRKVDDVRVKDCGRAASEVLVEIFCFCRVNPEHAVDLISEACGLEKEVIHSVWDISGEIWDYEDMKVLDANENDGADSRTYAARCKNVDVTLKLYNSASSTTMNTLLQLLSNLRFKHPSIFTLTKFFVDNRTGWIYVETPRVSGRLRDCIGKLDDKNTLSAFLHQIFFGVVKLHESGVVHGSVGPESVYVICPDEGSPRSQLILPKVFKEDTSKNKRDDIAAFGRLVQFVKENIPFLSGSNMIETKLILEIDEVIDACTNREDPSVADVLGLSFFRTVKKMESGCTCVLCLNNSATVLVTPCGHLCFCASCRSQASELETCPLCRTVIEGIIDVKF